MKVLPLNHEEAKELLHYDPISGLITWAIDKGCKMRKGSVAGTVDKNGHRVISVDYERIMAHRLAWFLHYGSWPEGELDHINRIGDDNRIANLRNATRTQQRMNASVSTINTSGATGVYKEKRTGKWYVQIKIGKTRINLGTFSSKQEAIDARREAELQHFVEFAPNRENIYE